MEKEFLDYDTSLALKELGFDEPCFGRFYTKSKSKMFGIDEKGRHFPIKNISKKLYTLGEDFVLNHDNTIIAPLYQQAFRFFREKYNLECIIDINTNFINNFQPIQKLYKINIIKSNEYSTERHNKLLWTKLNILSYEEAEQACLIKLIEICKTNFVK